MRCTDESEVTGFSDRTRHLLRPLALLLMAACSSVPPQRMGILVRAEADPGVPLQGVTVMLEGRALGESAANGSLPLSLAGPLGETVRLDVRCPAGHRPADAALRVVLRPADAHVPEYHVACLPSRRALVIAVRANNAVNVPLRYLDNEIGRTDREGVAHALVALAPGERAKFVLDTSAPEHRYLRPQSPVLQLNVPDHDAVVSLDQPFIIDAPKRAKPRPPERPIHF